MEESTAKSYGELTATTINGISRRSPDGEYCDWQIMETCFENPCWYIFRFASAVTTMTALALWMRSS